ncbi:MAG: two-component system regulatory protein YycI [Paenibacillus sp.]|uniref:Two-component signal transduction system YycFG, regulatory protein YycI n=1 Tax=Paenibacillus aquistagni TaxID=1852522 RepID=A0A1X7KKA9_9BACL|nr:two-component system regulatory protein YycI [Paenibacillus aquistagni]MBR2569428.1 two-component system regulatory protein YycI [Paenibacillus sp.]NMM52269.1 hypothetical protein [Paenibacillus aquistagni]SMG41561.1 Two-component signal transduction system YycFG, regulatory protein YycI [Paenibacillus aquistagni]
MDWSRAKSILIYAFLLLNVVLGYQLWQDVQERLSTQLDWTSLSEDAKQMKEAKNIDIPAKIPSETPSLREITYKVIENQQTRVPLKQVADSKIIYMSQKDFIEGLGDEIHYLEQYRHDMAINEDGVFILHQQLTNGLPLFEVKLKLYYENQKITGYAQQYVEAEESRELEDQKIITASQALGSVIMNHLSVGSIVRDIQLGYHGQLFDTDTQVASPTWRIMLEGGDVYYVNAISGSVEHVQGEKGKEA